MVKRKTQKKSDDISNWAVVLMLVAVIVVSTLSIVLFLDAADGKVKMESGDVGTVGLEMVNQDDTEEGNSSDLSEESLETMDESMAGNVALTVE